MNSLASWQAVVIGGGSAGLASAAELRRSGLAVTVLESGARPGDSWANRYRSLRLNTVRALSALPGLPIDHRHGDWVSGTDFADYLRRYAEHHGLDVRTGTRALAVDRAPGGGWQVETPEGVLNAEVVVVATGNAAVPVIPAWSDVFTGTRLHTAHYQGPGDIAGKQTLVVGSGNSATEIATELAAHGDRVWMSVRTSPLLVKSMQLGVSTHRLSVLGAGLPDWLWDASSLASHWSLYHDLAKLGLGQPAHGSSTKFRLTGVAPVAERGFAAAVRSGRIVIVPEVTGASGAGVDLADGTTLRPDTLLLATGYRPSFPALLSGLAVLNEDGQPPAWGTPLPGCEGLFVVGSSSLQGDIREHGREAARVGWAVRALAVGTLAGAAR